MCQENLDATWDAGALSCGELIVELRRRVNQLTPDQRLHLIATDPAAPLDIKAWCRVTGHRLHRAEHPHYTISRKEM